MNYKILPFLVSLAFMLFSCSNGNKSSNKASETEEIDNSQSEQTLDTHHFGGIQLYTLRDDMAKDPKTVLKEVADMGYAYIEAAGYSEGKFYGMTPEEFKATLAELNLTPIASHHGDISLDNIDDIIAADKAVGFEYVVIPIPPMGSFKYDNKTQTMSMSDDTEAIMSNINKIAEKCHEAGIGCLYHNHNMEFVKNSKGIVPMDYFIEHSNPEHLQFELDLYWVTKAGQNPVEWFKKAPGRFVAWHVKDMDNEGRFAPVGEGNIDFHEILSEKETSGMKYYFVEQDQTFNHTPLEAVKISHDHLQEIGFH